MNANRSMPPATVIPELAYRDVGAAVEWLCTAFGFVERLRIAEHRAQLCFGDGAVIVVDLPAAVAPDWSHRPAHSVMVRVDNVDEHFARAVRAGARTLGAPADQPYGERQYGAVDLGGHRWTFSQTTADVDPATWGGALRQRA